MPTLLIMRPVSGRTIAWAWNCFCLIWPSAPPWRASPAPCACVAAPRPWGAAPRLLLIVLRPKEKRNQFNHNNKVCLLWILTSFLCASSILRLFSAKISSSSSRFCFSSSYKTQTRRRLITKIDPLARSLMLIIEINSLLTSAMQTVRRIRRTFVVAVFCLMSCKGS